jgi:hypothetical protein
MKLIGFLFFCTLFIGVWAIDYPYDCGGTAPCDSACSSATVSCNLSASYHKPTSCRTDSTGTSITCTVLDGINTVAQTTSNCIGCSGGGPGDPGDGEFCDPVDPLWWVWCNPFPVL